MTWRLRGRIALGLMMSMTITGAACQTSLINLWGQPHTSQDDLIAHRVECPQRWGTFPIFPTADSVRDTTAFINGDTSGVAGDYGLRPHQWSIVTDPATGRHLYHPASAELGPAGAITNIPEFHDCQAFALDQTRFGDLFAIFASFQLERITHALDWEDVTWSSSNPTIVSVDGAGNLAAVGAGMALITATSKVDAARRGSTHVIVSAVPMETSASKRDSVKEKRGATNAGQKKAVKSLPATITVSVPSVDTAHLAIGDRATAVPQIGNVTTQSLAAAAIYSYGSGYSPLRIGPNFNCLYVYFDNGGTLRAKIVHVVDFAHSGTVCIGLVDPNATGGQWLSVNRTRPRPGDIPAVARWDRDPDTGQYFVGIACGDSWCEIGRQSASTSPAYVDAAAPSATDRAVAVKGWYDEQVLAWDTTHSGKPVPSGIIGTVIPIDTLAKLMDSTAFARFVTVAHVALDASHAQPGAVAYYEHEYNFRPAPVLDATGSWHPDSLNRLDLCFGTDASCGIPAGSTCPAAAPNGQKYDRWWMRITAAGGTPVKYHCVTRRDHAGYVGSMPGTARWRWILDDDTVWTECTQGCCQTERF